MVNDIRVKSGMYKEIPRGDSNAVLIMVNIGLRLTR